MVGCYSEAYAKSVAKAQFPASSHANGPSRTVELLGVELRADPLVAGDPARDGLVGLDRRRRAQLDGFGDRQPVAVPVRLELDPARAHLDELALLPDPRQQAHMRPAEPAEEQILERLPLPLVAALVDVEEDRPRRARLVVVVRDHERDEQAVHVDLADPALLDPPAEDAVADAVGGAAAGDAADHPARADRLAVARLEVGAADGEVGHARDCTLGGWTRSSRSVQGPGPGSSGRSTARRPRSRSAGPRSRAAGTR